MIEYSRSKIARPVIRILRKNEVKLIKIDTKIPKTTLAVGIFVHLRKEIMRFVCA